MKATTSKGALITLLTCLTLGAQEIKMPLNLDKLAQRATESVDVTLDASILQLASGFLSKNDPDEVKVKKIISNLKGVYVRSFEFAKEGQYSMSDVEAIRMQIKTPLWSKIVSVKSLQSENTEIYVKKEGDHIGGLVVLVAEPKELTVVHIDGPINPEQLSELSGHMGIPRIGRPKQGKSSKETTKDGDKAKKDEKPDHSGGDR
jgi:Domain of unknown function (DUF4252)